MNEINYLKLLRWAWALMLLIGLLLDAMIYGLFGNVSLLCKLC